MNPTRANPCRKTVLALTPLVISLIVVMVMGAGDNTGPYHGKIRSALIALACLGLVVMWYAILQTAKRRLNS